MRREINFPTISGELFAESSCKTPRTIHKWGPVRRSLHEPVYQGPKSLWQDRCRAEKTCGHGKKSLLLGTWSGLISLEIAGIA